MSFKPKRKSGIAQPRIQIRVTEEELSQITKGAVAAGLLIPEFSRQCVMYALDNMDAE